MNFYDKILKIQNYKYQPLKYITIYRKREKKTLYEHFNRYRKAFDNTEHTGMIKNSYKGKNKSQCLESDKEYLSRKKNSIKQPIY